MTRRRRPTGAVRKLPSGRWQASIWDAEQGRRITIGTFRTKADADAQISVAQTDASRGQWVDPARGRVTFGEYSRSWLSGRNDLRPRTRELYDGILRNHLNPTFESVPLGQMNAAQIRTWHSRVTGPLGPGAAQGAKAYSVLRTIMGTATADGLIAVNPVHIRNAGRETVTERPTVTIEQAFALARAINERFGALILLATFTGLRLGEIRGLRLRCLDLDARLVRVVEQVQEGGRGVGIYVDAPKTAAGVRTVAIPETIITTMQRWVDGLQSRRPSDYVFPGVAPGGSRSNPDRPFSKKFFYSCWHQAVDSVEGLPEGLHFHDLRHTGNTLAASTGASTRELMTRMGHASSQAALRYQHASQERDQAIAASLNEQIRQSANRGLVLTVQPVLKVLGSQTDESSDALDGDAALSD
jgi:integrase